MQEGLSIQIYLIYLQFLKSKKTTTGEEDVEEDVAEDVVVAGEAEAVTVAEEEAEAEAEEAVEEIEVFDHLRSKINILIKNLLRNQLFKNY